MRPVVARASARWNTYVVVLQGRGIGRHPFVAGRLFTRGVRIIRACDLCAREEREPVHQRPKRRRCAAFGKSATLLKPRDPGKSTF